LGAGAGVEVIVKFVVISGWGEGTLISFGGWTATSLSTLLTTQVISARSLLDNVVKWQRAWDCFVILSSRVCD